MMFQDDKSYVRAAWVWLVFCTLLRFVYSGTFPLLPDETNYWQWSRHMAWGYHDQAPMIAWTIKLGTIIFGHTEIGVRFTSVLAVTVVSIYLIALALRWFGPMTAFHTSLVTQSVMMFNAGGLLSTPDGIQAAAWAGASYHVACAYENHQWRQWLIGGLWFGLGMLSKYTMVIFLPCAYLYGLFSKTHRTRLADVRPYIGVLLGSCMFFPVIAWNAQNSWNSFRHVAFIGGANEKFAIHVKYLGEYIGGQAAIVSPLVFFLILFAWFMAVQKRYRSQNWIYPYLFFTSFPMFAGFALLSLHSRVEANWPGVAYITASVLTAAFFSGKSDPAADKKTVLGRKIWPWALGTSYFFTLVLLLHVVWPFLPIPIEKDRITREIYGWRELGEGVDEIRKTMPNQEKTFIFGLQYQVASELAFYTPGNPRTVSVNKWSRPNVYDYWWKDEDLIGWDAVGVSYGSMNHKSRFNQIFARVDPPVEIKVYGKGHRKRNPDGRKPFKTYYAYRAYGFKGGLRWIPSDKSDIRAN